MAIYTLKKDTLLKKTFDVLNKRNYLDAINHNYYDDRNLTRFMAALIFQINPSEVEEVIYREELIDSINKKEEERFLTIANSEYFEHLFDEAFDSSNSIGNQIELLSLLKENDLDELVIERRWKKLYQQQLSSIRNRNFELYDYELILIGKITKSQAIFYLEDLFAELHYRIEQNNIKRFVHIVDRVLNKIVNDELEINLNEFLVKKTVNIDSFFELLMLTKDDFLKYKIETNETELNNRLSSDATGLNFNPCLRVLNEQYNLEAYNKSLDSLISNYESKLNEYGIRVNGVDDQVDEALVLSQIYDQKKILYSPRKPIPIINERTALKVFNLLYPTDVFYIDAIVFLLKLHNQGFRLDRKLTLAIQNLEENRCQDLLKVYRMYSHDTEIVLDYIPLQMYNFYGVLIEELFNIDEKPTGDVINLIKEFHNLIKLPNIKSRDLFLYISKGGVQEIPFESIHPIFLETALQIKTEFSTNIISSSKKYLASNYNKIWKEIFEKFNTDLEENIKLLKFHKIDSDTLELFKEAYIFDIDYFVFDYTKWLKYVDLILNSNINLNQKIFFEILVNEIIDRKTFEIDHVKPLLIPIIVNSDRKRNAVLYRLIKEFDLHLDSFCVEVFKKNKSKIKKLAIQETEIISKIDLILSA